MPGLSDSRWAPQPQQGADGSARQRGSNVENREERRVGLRTTQRNDLRRGEHRTNIPPPPQPCATVRQCPAGLSASRWAPCNQDEASVDAFTSLSSMPRQQPHNSMPSPPAPPQRIARPERGSSLQGDFGSRHDGSGMKGRIFDTQTFPQPKVYQPQAAPQAIAEALEYENDVVMSDYYGFDGNDQEHVGGEEEEVLPRSTSPEPLNCSICLERLGTHGPPKALPCSHVFCTRCIDRWLGQDGNGNGATCPIDRVDASGVAYRAPSRGGRRGGRRRWGGGQRP